MSLSLRRHTVAEFSLLVYPIAGRAHLVVNQVTGVAKCVALKTREHLPPRGRHPALGRRRPMGGKYRACVSSSSSHHPLLLGDAFSEPAEVASQRAAFCPALKNPICNAVDDRIRDSMAVAGLRLVGIGRGQSAHQHHLTAETVDCVNVASVRHYGNPPTVERRRAAVVWVGPMVDAEIGLAGVLPRPACRRTPGGQTTWDRCSLG